MDIKNKYFWTEAFHCVGITVFAILLTVLITHGLTPLSVFSPLERSADFQMSDLYQSVKENKAEHKRSSDITIVSVDGCGREEVIDVVTKISADYSPAAIGMDVYFRHPGEDDTKLFGMLENTPNLVCASSVARDEQGEAWHQDALSFFDGSIDVVYGYVNLTAASRREAIRTFVPLVLTSNNDTLLSMSAQLAKMCRPDSYKKLLARNKEEETIAFEDIEFHIELAKDVLNDNVVDASSLKDRIILIGDIGNLQDSYLSPLHGSIPGVVVHAYALQTILDDNYIDTTPAWLNWVVAIVLCVLLTSCNLWAGYRRSIYVRIAQFVIIYLLIVIGCAYFASHHTYIDFSLSIYMIGFGLVAFDIWFGFVALYKFIKTKIFKK